MTPSPKMLIQKNKCLNLFKIKKLYMNIIYNNFQKQVSNELD